MLMLLALLALPLDSGVPVGGRPGPYSFLVATGPERGKQTCYVCEQDTKPATIVFARKLSPEVGALFAKLDKVAADAPKEKGYKLWLTYVGEGESLDALADWSRKHGVRVSPAGVYDDRDGPPAYKLAPEAEVTVLVFVDRKVVANLSLRAEELTDDAVSRAVAAAQKVAK